LRIFIQKEKKRLFFLSINRYLRQLFRNLFHRQGFTYDYVFDWNMLKFSGQRFDTNSANEGSTNKIETNGFGASGSAHHQHHQQHSGQQVYASNNNQGVYRRTSKDVHQNQPPPPQSASNNSKQQMPTGTDTGRSSSARATKKIIVRAHPFSVFILFSVQRLFFSPSLS